VPADAGAPADVQAPVAEAGCYGDRRAYGAYSDARYDAHCDVQQRDASLAGAVRRAVKADVVVPADVVAAGRMHKFLITGICMRICTFSCYKGCKSHTL
jgi:hypothetical protein